MTTQPTATTMTDAELDALVARLRAKDVASFDNAMLDYGDEDFLVNPDGPEAAAALDELRERQRFYGDVVDFAAGHCGPEEAIAFLGDVQADVDGDRLNAWHGFAAFRARQAKGEGQ